MISEWVKLEIELSHVLIKISVWPCLCKAEAKEVEVSGKDEMNHELRSSQGHQRGS